MEESNLNGMKNDLIFRMARPLCAPEGISGREGGIAAVAEEQLKKLGPVVRTPLGSLLCTVNEGMPNAPHLLLEAHMDQIGLVVTRVEEDGFLRFASVGGIDARWLPASPVIVHAATGDFPAVVSSVPPHLKGKDDKKGIKLEDLLLDTGFSTKSAKILFAPGDAVTFEATLMPLQNDRICGMALDDRIGCVAVLAAAAMIAKQKPAARVTVMLASMEEVGGQGALTAAFAVQPDYAVAVDVGFGDGYGVKAEQSCPLGKGPMLGIAPILDREFSARLRRAAKENGIPLQDDPMGGRTGTDADDIALTGSGVHTALISIALRSMHTVVETVDSDDVMNTARLLALAAEEVPFHE